MHPTSSIQVEMHGDVSTRDGVAITMVYPLIRGGYRGVRQMG